MLNGLVSRWVRPTDEPMLPSCKFGILTTIHHTHPPKTLRTFFPKIRTVYLNLICVYVWAPLTLVTSLRKAEMPKFTMNIYLYGADVPQFSKLVIPFEQLVIVLSRLIPLIH